MDKDRFFSSIIITTYNWPAALAKILEALAQQSCQHFEVIVADDGSGEETAQLIRHCQVQYNFSIKHIWQQDKGFRAAKIRNKAVSIAKGSYLIFLDGDCIPLKTFVKRHDRLSEKGWFVAGNRVLLSEKFSHDFLSFSKINILHSSYWHWFVRRLIKSCNRISPLFYFPFMPRKFQKNQWKGVKTCNLGVWKKDFIAVNGFDETYEGWGFEDSDLAIRLIKHKIMRKNGHFALGVIHLWHAAQDRSSEKKNLARLAIRSADYNTFAMLGINQYGEYSTQVETSAEF